MATGIAVTAGIDSRSFAGETCGNNAGPADGIEYCGVTAGMDGDRNNLCDNNGWRQVYTWTVENGFQVHRNGWGCAGL